MSAPPPVRIRALVVDDEPIARAGLRDLLEGEEGIDVAGEAGDGVAAAGAILETRPDVVFLDIQMPGIDGFGVIEAVGADAMPPVVFVTAYDEYAVRAFEVHALDYLLKPVDPQRFRTTIARVRARAAAGPPGVLHPGLVRAFRALPGATAYPERMLVKGEEKLVVVDVRSIAWISAEGDYVRIRWKGGTLIARSTMAAMESRLDPSRFARIHRSTIVAVSRVRELRPSFSGDHVVVLDDDSKFTVSRQSRPKLLALLGGAGPLPGL